jgi:hypothetical protein
VLVALYLFAGAAQFGAEWLIVSPSSDMRTLDGYLHRHPASRVVKITKDGKRYYVIFGAQVLFNEYPAGYLFNADGQMLGWHSEAGNVDRFSDF